MTNVPMTLPDLVLATHKTPFFHSSTFVELEDGRILHAAGSRFTTSDDGGITWSDISPSGTTSTAIALAAAAPPW